MKSFREFCTHAVVSGLLVVVPIYLVGLLLMKVIRSLQDALQPVEALLPDLPFGEYLLAVVILLLLCFLVGVAIQTATGQAIRDWFQAKVFARIPGYSLVQGLTQQFAGMRDEKMWRPALAEIEDALVPAFIVEELDDGHFTVFVPSVPTPLAGTVYILTPERVHLLDIPFSQAALIVARWGVGSKDLIAAMKRRSPGKQDTMR